LNTAGIGDLVASKSASYSKEKRWRLLEILERANDSTRDATQVATTPARVNCSAFTLPAVAVINTPSSATSSWAP